MSVPRRNTTQGFASRNRAVGKSWTTLHKKHKAIFHPPLFKRLAHAVSEAQYLPTPPTEHETSEVDAFNAKDKDPCNPADLTPYIPIFKELVNMEKVNQHIDRGCLGEQRGMNVEKKGRTEVSKVVDQVNSPHKSHKFAN